MASVVDLGQALRQGRQQQPINPKSAIGQMLLRKGSRINANQAGSGIRSAGESILGALLLSKGFQDQQALELSKREALAKAIQSAFPGKTIQTSPEQTIPGKPMAPPEEDFYSKAGGRITGDVAPDPVPEPSDPNMRVLDAMATANVTNRFRQPESFSTGPALSPTLDILGPSTTIPAQTRVEPNKMGQMLLNLSKEGLIDPSTVVGAFQNQQLAKAEQERFEAEQSAKREAANQKFTRDKQLKSILPGGIVPKSSIIDGNVVVPDGAGGFTSKKVINLEGTAKGKEVKRSDILDDGSAVLVFKDGSTGVRDPQGNLITGAARLEVLKNALQFSLNKARRISGEKEAGSSAIKQSAKMFEQLSGIEQGMTLYDDAIAQVDAGAGTGPIMSLLPSVREASINLDNIQAQLGLNVIQRTTFGSLSQSELKFALNAALPKGLKGPALRDWLVRKKNAQQKLANYIQHAAVYIGTPGNTEADWFKIQEEAQKSRGGTSPQAPVTQESLEGMSDAEFEDFLNKRGNQ